MYFRLFAIAYEGLCSQTTGHGGATRLAMVVLLGKTSLVGSILGRHPGDYAKKCIFNTILALVEQRF